AELALAPARHRGQHLDAASLRQLEQAVDDFRDRLRADRLATPETVRITHAGVEEPQEVMDLRDGAYRRAGISPARLLLDRDGGRESLDRVDIGLLHLLQELARIGRQRFDVASLAFRVQRVEGE